MSVLNTVSKYRGKGIHIWVGLVLLVFILIQTVSGILMLAGDHGGRDGGRYDGRYGGPAAQFRNGPGNVQGNAQMMQSSGVPMGRQGVLGSAGVMMPGQLRGDSVTQQDRIGDGAVVPQQSQLNGGAITPQANSDQLAQSFGGQMGRHRAFGPMGDPNMLSGFGARYGEPDGLSVRGIHGSWFLAVATLILLLIHVYYSLGLHFFGFKYRKKQAKSDVKTKETGAATPMLEPDVTRGALPEM
jgi:hypothetical protein